jgi:hypothetical protein
MNRATNAHLTEDAMLRWQAGDASKAEQQHITACAECQAQAKPLADALVWFGAAARQWAEEKADATQEWRGAKASAAQEWGEARSAAAMEWGDAKLHARRRWRPLIASWASVAVILLLMFGVGLPRWKAHRNAIETQARQHQMQQELARDNALLEEVDQDVSQVVPAAMEPLSWNNSASVAGTITGSSAGKSTRQ